MPAGPTLDPQVPAGPTLDPQVPAGPTLVRHRPSYRQNRPARASAMRAALSSSVRTPSKCISECSMANLCSRGELSSAGVGRPRARRAARRPRTERGVAVGPRMTVRSVPFFASRTRSASRPASSSFPQNRKDQSIRWRRAGDHYVQCAVFLLRGSAGARSSCHAAAPMLPADFGCTSRGGSPTRTGVGTWRRANRWSPPCHEPARPRGPAGPALRAAAGSADPPAVPLPALDTLTVSALSDVVVAASGNAVAGCSAATAARGRRSAAVTDSAAGSVSVVSRIDSATHSPANPAALDLRCR